MDFRDNIEEMFTKLEDMFKAKTVIGDPIVIGEVTLVPVVNVTFGIGGGGREGDFNEHSMGMIGVGSGARLTPSAVIVIIGNQVSMLPMAGLGSIEHIMEIVPEVLGKVKKAIQKEPDFKKSDPC